MSKRRRIERVPGTDPNAFVFRDEAGQLIPAERLFTEYSNELLNIVTPSIRFTQMSAIANMDPAAKQWIERVQLWRQLLERDFPDAYALAIQDSPHRAEMSALLKRHLDVVSRPERRNNELSYWKRYYELLVRPSYFAAINPWGEPDPHGQTHARIDAAQLQAAIAYALPEQVIQRQLQHQAQFTYARFIYQPLARDADTLFYMEMRLCDLALPVSDPTYFAVARARYPIARVYRRFNSPEILVQILDNSDTVRARLGRNIFAEIQMPRGQMSWFGWKSVDGFTSFGILTWSDYASIYTHSTAHALEAPLVSAQCTNCGTTAAPLLRQCGACAAPGIAYCGRECQVAHWGVHEINCKR
jgi:hypothetical protein